MKRICIILDKPNKGGVGSVTNALSTALADKYEIHIIYLFSEEPLPKSSDERIKTSVLLNRYHKTSQLRKLSKPLLKKYITENKIDLAILQTYYSGFAASTLRYTTNAKLIYCEHCSVIHFKDTPVKDTLCQLLSSLFCHKVVTLTEATKNEYIKKFHLPEKKVTTIYNWLDFSIPHSDEYNLESKQIISAGRIAPEKRFDNLIKAFAIVNKKFPDWKLHIYGDGELTSETNELIKNLDLSENVILPGMVSNLRGLYKNYAFYVMSSKREGMPVVLLEAKLNRLPIVSYDIFTGPSEIVRNGTDGILVPDGDIDELANAMIKLVEDKGLRKQMSDNSQENLEKFSKETILKQWFDLIESLI